LRDLYGQLIDGKSGRRGQIREGGDGESAQRGAPKKIELVALYSGLVEVGKDGKATVAFDIPDYNGRLRLMAVAYDAQNVGWAEAGLVVRDPVIAEISAPRFLAPGDKSNLSLTSAEPGRRRGPLRRGVRIHRRCATGGRRQRRRRAGAGRHHASARGAALASASAMARSRCR
jgi:hypothetical protein